MTRPAPSGDARLPGPFTGRAGRTVAESTPAWTTPVRPARNAPNIITIVLDDVGFGQLGCYGSSIATPRIDGLAANGIRYNNFHVTALCSPTRASLLTGRNHHAVGVGFLADFDTGYPSYRGAVTVEAAMLPELLREGGYGTYAVGKWHLTPPSDMTPAGPFHQWPTGRGFDRYYGFLWGEDDQWAPELWYDQHHVEVPQREDYHASEDFVDRAIEFISDHVSSTPQRPFYTHLAFGAAHAPHQAPRHYIDRYRGAFDHGWDLERERVLGRQIASGLVPEGTELPEPNPGVARWADLGSDEQRLYARMQEVFAGFMEHTDAQIGRLLDFLSRYELLDDTIIVLMSDNGASGEGGPHGSANEYRYFLGLDDSLENGLRQIDDLGGPYAHNHYPSGWAQAGNTPLRRYKKFAFGGGVRAPLIVHWPNRLGDPGAVRPQFHHVIDITPTLLELAGLQAPADFRGVPQLPMHGTSMSYSFDDPDLPSTRTVQYFETAGYRGLVRDGYKIVAEHVPGTDYDDDRWELYHLEEDFAESRDLAAELPELVEALADQWWAEATRYSVLPLDDRMQTRVDSRDPATERLHYRLLPGARIPNGSAGPNIGGRSFRIAVKLAPMRGDESGVLLSYGRRAAGFSFFMERGRPSFDLNLAGEHVIVDSESAVPAGTTQLVLTAVRSGEDVVITIEADGEIHGRGSSHSLMPAGLGCLSLQVGYNSPSPVSRRYVSPNRFDGEIVEALLELDPEREPLAAEAWEAALAQE